MRPSRLVNVYKRKYLERVPLCTAKAVERENFHACALAAARRAKW